MDTATFSPCRTYRYSLSRIWSPTKLALFIMLNPSTADEVRNDPTIERCQRRAKMLGYGGLRVCNLFAYRSTDPAQLYRVDDPIGPENDSHILENAKTAGIIICGWGNHGRCHGRSRIVTSTLKNAGHTLHCLKVNKSTKEPAHPLYIGYKQEPMIYEISA